jgi:DNA-directed RNA polymerase subunit M/transcription elongation factor TFIIS
MEKYIPEEPQRKKVYTRLYEIIVKEGKNVDQQEDELPAKFPKTNDDVIKMALNIERGIFNYALKQYGERALMTGNIEDMDKKWNGKFKQFYVGRAVCIVSNLNPEGYLGNKNLIKRLMTGQFNEFEMCEFDAQKIFLERYDEIVFKFGTKFDYRPIDISERPDGILQCRKCKSYKTEYNEKMTRSADEPTTKFCYCHNCGNRWKFC